MLRLLQDTQHFCHDLRLQNLSGLALQSADACAGSEPEVDVAMTQHVCPFSSCVADAVGISLQLLVLALP